MRICAGGKPVFYRCDPNNEWNPDIDDINSKITDRTKAILVINRTTDRRGLQQGNSVGDCGNRASASSGAAGGRNL